MASPTPAPSATPGKPDAIYNSSLDIGGGRRLRALCYGHGTPTILLEGGGLTPSYSDWDPAFVEALARTTTVCQYSRAGGSGSTAVAWPRTMDEIISDAFALLDNLAANSGVEPPYVFVGWSFGGYVALGEALKRSDQTAAVAILDTDFPRDFLKACAE